MPAEQTAPRWRWTSVGPFAIGVEEEFQLVDARSGELVSRYDEVEEELGHEIDVKPELVPRSGLPPAYASFEEWRLAMERAQRVGFFDDYTYIWWALRLHPTLGTVEIRICDGQTRQRVCARTDGAAEQRDCLERGGSLLAVVRRLSESTSEGV